MLPASFLCGKQWQYMFSHINTSVLLLEMKVKAEADINRQLMSFTLIQILCQENMGKIRTIQNLLFKSILENFSA